MDKFTPFIGTMLSSVVQAKIYHWQVLEEGSYAAHIALAEYQDGIDELIDGLVESYQGRFGLVKGFRPATQYREDNDPKSFFEGLRKYVEMSRYNFTQDTYIQSQIDEVVQLIETTIYKLTNLR